MQRDLAALLDILSAAELAVSFVAGMTFDQFCADQKTQSAVLHQLIVMGEAARRVSLSFRAETSSLPWPQILGIRNRLVHEYEKVKLNIVWETLHQDLPGLILWIKPFIPAEP